MVSSLSLFIELMSTDSLFLSFSVCPTIPAPAPAPATPTMPFIIAVCTAAVVVTALGVAGVWIWIVVKRARVAEENNRALHRLLLVGAGHRSDERPAETVNISAATAGGPINTGYKTYASTPRRSPFATVSPAGQYARYSGVPLCDPPPPTFPRSSFSTPFPIPRVPPPPFPRPQVPWIGRNESWLGF